MNKRNNFKAVEDVQCIKRDFKKTFCNLVPIILCLEHVIK